MIIEFKVLIGLYNGITVCKKNKYGFFSRLLQ